MVLVEMIKFEGTKRGQEIAAQMLDVTIRVKDVRPFAVKQMVSMWNWRMNDKTCTCVTSNVFTDVYTL